MDVDPPPKAEEMAAAQRLDLARYAIEAGASPKDIRVDACGVIAAIPAKTPGHNADTWAPWLDAQGRGWWRTPSRESPEYHRIWRASDWADVKFSTLQQFSDWKDKQVKDLTSEISANHGVNLAWFAAQHGGAKTSSGPGPERPPEESVGQIVIPVHHEIPWVQVSAFFAVVFGIICFFIYLSRRGT